MKVLCVSVEGLGCTGEGREVSIEKRAELW